MIWSVNAKGATPEELVAAVEALEINYGGYSPSSPVDEWNAQLAAAKGATKAIVESGALGDAGMFSASLSGHAPFAHERSTPGSSSDSISVYLTRSPHVPEPTATA